MNNKLDINEEKLNELIVVENVSVIKQNLQFLSDEVDKEIEFALSLNATEENKVEVKQARARLNNIKSVLEQKRKTVKELVMKPYQQFEEIYNDMIKNKFEKADDTLKNKINEIENAQKTEKETMLREFAERQFRANEIQDIVNFDDIGLNITLSASEKSLKDQIVNFVERIRNDLDTILLEDLKDEILVEYKKCLNYTQAKQIVLQRHKDLEIAKEQSEKLNNIKQEETKLKTAVYDIIEENGIQVPQEINNDEEILIVTFTVKSTREKLKLLKQFMLENEISYE